MASTRRRRPVSLKTLTELPRAMVEATHLLATLPSLSLVPRGDGHPLLLIPGFLASDRSLVAMRGYLNSLGYKTETWGLGRNMGKPEHLFEHLPEKLLEMADRAGEPVSLVGQSLGGVFARELAREYPELTRQVITLGSPFGARNSNFTHKALSHLYRVSSGASVDDMLSLMRARELHISSDVPRTAIYSKGDGVVHWESCREAEEDHLTQNIEVLGSHCGMGFNAMIYYIVADRLSQPALSWRRFQFFPELKTA